MIEQMLKKQRKNNSKGEKDSHRMERERIRGLEVEGRHYNEDKYIMLPRIKGSVNDSINGKAR